MADYLTKGQSITGSYYRTLLTKLRDNIKKKLRGMLTNERESSFFMTTHQLMPPMTLFCFVKNWGMEINLAPPGLFT